MDGSIFAARNDDIEYIKFVGTVRYSHCAGLESHIDRLFDKNDFDEIVIDLEEADILDSTALGLLARIAIELKKKSTLRPVIFLRQGELNKVLKRVCFDQVFTILLDTEQQKQSGFKKLANLSQSEDEILQRVIEAHHNLAKIDKKNQAMYQEITAALN